jgi:two-component system sensor histidine kinase/response regulator
MTTQACVLVVDDSLANRELASANLTAAGYSVQLAEDGEQGLAMFAARQPDLVLLDMMMPGMNGFEVYKRLRASPGGQETAIVFVTALNDLVSHQQALASGADDFLTKPINRTELLLRVRSLLWIKRLKVELREGYELIRTQRDALLAAQAQREALTSLVVHDLKNPLTAILFNAEWLADNCPDVEDRGSAQQIVGAALAMNRMVMNLLDISRSEDGMLVPRISRVDLSALIGKTASAQSQREVQQKLEVSAPKIVIDADADLLRRLLENLIDNAKKYSPPASTIRVDVGRGEPGWVELRVIDEGSGIPTPLRERIFDKYARLDLDTSEHVNSSRGLGLTYCRLAAEVHGGKIWVDGTAEGGSCFHVRLPESQKG